MFDHHYITCSSLYMDLNDKIQPDSWLNLGQIMKCDHFWIFASAYVLSLVQMLSLYDL